MMKKIFRSVLIILLGAVVSKGLVGCGNSAKVEPTEETCCSADQSAEFPGGENLMLQFVGNNITYPQNAQDAKTDGMVEAEYVVGADGAVRDVKVTASVSPELDAEVLRIIRKMPKWTPAVIQNKNVSSVKTLKIAFVIKGSEFSAKPKDGATMVVTADPAGAE